MNVLEQALEALEKLARLGNEPHYGNSKGNDIAIKALAAIKEVIAKQGEPQSAAVVCLLTTELDALLKAAKREALLEVAGWLSVEHGRIHEPFELFKMAEELK